MEKTDEDERIEYMRLWDLYGALLTPTQREIADSYFNLDLTLSEIAEQKSISRQGASECLKVCKNQLREYEQKLGFMEREREIEASAASVKEDLESWSQDPSKDEDKFAAILKRLDNI